MKTWIVSSNLTFVPDNYDDFLLPMATHPDVDGLILLENRSLTYLVQGLFLGLSGAAPRLGFQLLKNFFQSKISQRKRYYVSLNKKVHVTRDLHSPQTLDFLKNQQPDLIVNARTRVLFKPDLLNIPRLGCLNIHHGLLPDQRGLMCDFWALLEGDDLGFSIHKMTEKIDAGLILATHVTVTSTGPLEFLTDYLECLRLGSKKESEVLGQILSEISQSQELIGEANQRTPKTRFRKNPTWFDFLRLRRRGVKI